MLIISSFLSFIPRYFFVIHKIVKWHRIMGKRLFLSECFFYFLLKKIDFDCVIVWSFSSTNISTIMNHPTQSGEEKKQEVSNFRR